MLRSKEKAILCAEKTGNSGKKHAVRHVNVIGGVSKQQFSWLTIETLFSGPRKGRHSEIN
jgi:hypothetical protein